MPRMGVVLLGLGIAFVAVALVYISFMLWLGLLFLWFGVVFAAVGIAYCARYPGIFGKAESTGDLGIINTLLLLPYLAVYWIVWEANVRTGSEACFHEIAPGLWLGRRPRMDAELPLQTALIVDLTSEFRLSSSLDRTKYRYRCLPTLDHAAPANRSRFESLVSEVAAYTDGPVYVHCAVGRGRSALFVAAVVQARGLAPDAGSAWEYVRARRPSVGLSSEQRQFLNRGEAI